MAYIFSVDIIAKHPGVFLYKWMDYIAIATTVTMVYVAMSRAYLIVIEEVFKFFKLIKYKK